MTELVPIKDIDELLNWRKEVIENVFGVSPDKNLMARNKAYYRHHLHNKTHIPFLAIYNGIKAGCGSICITEELPSPDNPSGRCAYLMNIYVRQQFREHGIGHSIVRKLVAEAGERGCNKIYLETTPEGRPVYESLGFKDLPDMMKLTNPPKGM